MLSGSALLRVLLTLVVAAVLAALWQVLPPLTGGAPTPTVERPRPAPPATNPAPTPRTVGPPATPPPAPPPPQAAPSPQPAPPPAAAAVPDPVPPAVPNPTEADTALREGTPAVADTRPVAVGLVDLNTATVLELNRLRGGGMIGRAVVRARPYASVDELLSKRVLSRSTYERIRDQVTVR